MEKMIVVVDDADHAHRLLAPLQGTHPSHDWVVLVCPPKLTRHIGRWVNAAARDAWRKKWAQEVALQLQARLGMARDSLQWRVAKGSLMVQVERLQKQIGCTHVLDARRTRLGQELESVSSLQPTSADASWLVPGGATALGVAFMLAAD